MVVEQHLCDIQNLVQIGRGISEEMWWQTNKHTQTYYIIYIDYTLLVTLLSELRRIELDKWI